ncbi:MAG: hypothetical protein IPJ88_01060 [Myxococcales bacterium]|nr:MAG: hypothetical protein IPJ88_01060 [Myxococcales bacterium]
MNTKTKNEAIVTSAEDAGGTLAAWLRSQKIVQTWKQARECVERGRVEVDGRLCTNPDYRLSADQSIVVHASARIPRRGTLAKESILYVDRDVVVVHKAPHVLTVPYEKTDRDTLVDQTRVALRKLSSKQERGYDPMLGVVQRLDKETSGILVFARTLSAKRHLQQQFRVHSVVRRYYAWVQGTPKKERIESWILPNRGDGLRGSHGHFRRARGGPPEGARRALTIVEEATPHGPVSLVRIRLETGRQHQI